MIKSRSDVLAVSQFTGINVCGIRSTALRQKSSGKNNDSVKKPKKVAIKPPPKTAFFAMF